MHYHKRTTYRTFRDDSSVRKSGTEPVKLLFDTSLIQRTYCYFPFTLNKEPHSSGSIYFHFWLNCWSLWVSMVSLSNDALKISDASFGAKLVKKFFWSKILVYFIQILEKRNHLIFKSISYQWHTMTCFYQNFVIDYLNSYEPTYKDWIDVRLARQGANSPVNPLEERSLQNWK